MLLFLPKKSARILPEFLQEWAHMGSFPQDGENEQNLS